MCAMNVGIVMQNLAALRAAVFTLSAKTQWEGGYSPPPSVRGLPKKIKINIYKNNLSPKILSGKGDMQKSLFPEKKTEKCLPRIKGTSRDLRSRGHEVKHENFVKPRVYIYFYVHCEHIHILMFCIFILFHLDITI